MRSLLAATAVVLLCLGSNAFPAASAPSARSRWALDQSLPERSPRTRRQRSLLGGTRCTGCSPGYCFPASGCAQCSAQKGWQPDGKGGCVQGTPQDPSNERVAQSSSTKRRFEFHPLSDTYAVLARGKSAPVFGFGNTGATVTVTLKSSRGTRIASGSTKVNSQGQWLVRLGSLHSGSGFVLEAKIGSATIVAKDVAVGELWLASGQSNAFVSLGDITYRDKPWSVYAERELQKASADSQLRLFKVPTLHSSQPELTVDATWQLPSRDVVDSFSATAYLMGVQMRKQMHVPVGIVQSAYGGTSIVQWLPPDVIAAFANIPRTNFEEPWRNLFNAMIAPLKGTDWSGVTWYQGESDGGLTFETPLFAYYQQLLEAMIKSWRVFFGDPKLAFELVQLPNYRSIYASSLKSRKNLNNWPYVREGERQTALNNANVDLISAIDLGQDLRVHPPNKWDVASRLVNTIQRLRRHHYSVPATGPTFLSATYAARKAMVQYSNVGSKGLVIGKKSNSIGGVSLQPSNSAVRCYELRIGGSWVPATGKRANSKSVEVTAVGAKSATAPSGVRFGWSDAPHCNLYSSDLLPAVPFTTDTQYDALAREAQKQRAAAS